jgi:hypothetical protein
MNTLHSHLSMVWMLIGLVSSACPATAFYDANAGRWINRDPINEAGFTMDHRGITADIAYEEVNLYSFVANSPLVNTDLYGLQGFIGPGPSPPPHVPRWSTPAGTACNAYNCNSALKSVCNCAGSDCWANCVRGCLLEDWDAATCSYKSGFFNAHFDCWGRCTSECAPSIPPVFGPRPGLTIRR